MEKLAVCTDHRTEYNSDNIFHFLGSYFSYLISHIEYITVFW